MFPDFLLRLGVGHERQSPCSSSVRPSGLALLIILNPEEFKIEGTKTVQIELNLDTKCTPSGIGPLCMADPCFTKPLLDYQI